MIKRRHLFLGTAMAAAAGGLRRARAAGASWPGLDKALARIAAEQGGRLGVAVLDTRTGRIAGHRSGERFPMCSTFKMLLGGAVLARVDAGQEQLNRRLRYDSADLLPWSPATEKHVGPTGMTMAELCAATITLSDNTAANLILQTLGGPAGLTAVLRGWGDAVTRLDRTEPALNEALPDDPRDTTTPAAMLDTMRRLTLGNALSEASRQTLTGWLLDNKTGDARLRARLPEGWRTGDKTGTGQRNTSNDIGLLWPPGQPPVLVTAYLTEGSANGAERDATLAAVGAAVAAAL